MKLKKVIKTANHQITEGSEYGWQCYGPNARWMDFSNNNNVEVGSCVYDTKSKKVFEVQSYNDSFNTHYTWRDDDYIKAYEDEANDRGVDPYNAYDDKQTVTVSKDSILSILESYCSGDDSDLNSKGLSPEVEWPFPVQLSAEDDVDNDGVNHRELNSILKAAGEVLDEITEEEIEAAFPGATMKNEYEVTLNVKARFTVKADSMEEAADTAAEWYVQNKSTEPWPKGLCWEDRWISKKTVSAK